MADDILYEPDLDEFLQEIHQGGVDENPLRVTVHLYPKRRRALIHWEVLDVPGWKYTYVIGRKYTNEIPKVTKDEDDPTNSSKRIEGSSAKKGTKEIKLKPSETLFFGFWVNVEQVKINNKPIGGG